MAIIMFTKYILGFESIYKYSFSYIKVIVNLGYLE